MYQILYLLVSAYAQRLVIILKRILCAICIENPYPAAANFHRYNTKYQILDLLLLKYAFHYKSPTFKMCYVCLQSIFETHIQLG
jgi:hypothetical protein